jgi:hypothetical protein
MRVVQTTAGGELYVMFRQQAIGGFFVFLSKSD